jgi:uncharacterized repeat protein (TIGR01451 family)
LTNGEFKPRNNLLGDAFPAPAPVGPYTNDLFSIFNGANPNGTWSLYVVDDLNLFSGSIASGWGLTLLVNGVVPPAADLSLTGGVNPTSAVISNNFTYTFAVTNHGPSAASAVTLSNALPVGGQLVSAIVSQGTVNTNTPGVVLASIGSLAKDATATLTLVVHATQTGVVTSQAAVSSSVADPNAGNSAVSLEATVSAPAADLAVALFDAPDPVYLGGQLVYSIFVTNLGPSTATAVSVTNTLPGGVTFVGATPAGFTQSGGIITFTNLGNLGSSATLMATVTVLPTVIDTLTYEAAASSTLFDPLKGNNVASIKTVVTAPGLTYSASAGSLTLKWPADAAGYSLEQTTNLVPPAIWVSISNPPPQLIGGEYIYTVGTTNGGGYFRLKRSQP